MSAPARLAFVLCAGRGTRLLPLTRRLPKAALPVAGVQFHPESLMSLGNEVGLRIVENAFRLDAGAN